MDPDTILFLIYDREGQIIAFPSRAEAEECLIVDVREASIREQSFGWLVENHPKALVRIYSQYYWAEELA